jgi:hypothetical protein
MTKYADMTPAERKAKNEEALNELKKAHNEIFSAEVCLATEKLKNIPGLSHSNVAHIISLLADADKHLRHEVVLFERKIIEGK